MKKENRFLTRLSNKQIGDFRKDYVERRSTHYTGVGYSGYGNDLNSELRRRGLKTTQQVVNSRRKRENGGFGIFGSSGFGSSKGGFNFKW